MITLTAQEGYVYTNGKIYGKQVLIPSEENIEYTNNESYGGYAVITEETFSVIEAEKAAELEAEKGEISRGSINWNNHQAAGARRDYSFAFVEWQDTTISPYYPITANTIIYCFKGCTKLINFKGEINVIGENPSVMGICMGCESLENGLSINFVLEDGNACPVVKTWTAAYAGCKNLKTAVIDFGARDSSDTTGDTLRNNMQNTFQGCVNLETIEFKGFGSPLKLDLSDCSKLTAQSIASLANHLLDVTLKDGDFEIVIPFHLVDGMTSYLDSAISRIEELGWTITIKDADA